VNEWVFYHGNVLSVGRHVRLLAAQLYVLPSTGATRQARCGVDPAMVSDIDTPVRSSHLHSVYPAARKHSLADKEMNRGAAQQ
jgi:hypothetical protein